MWERIPYGLLTEVWRIALWELCTPLGGRGRVPTRWGGQNGVVIEMSEEGMSFHWRLWGLGYLWLWIGGLGSLSTLFPPTGLGSIWDPNMTWWSLWCGEICTWPGREIKRKSVYRCLWRWQMTWADVPWPRVTGRSGVVLPPQLTGHGVIPGPDTLRSWFIT